MKKIKKVFETMFESRNTKIITLSVGAFLGGMMITGVVISTINKSIIGKGVGGLETPVQAEINESGGVKLISATDGIESDGTDALDSKIDFENSSSSLFLDENSLTYRTYRVQQGDMIGFIADKYDVTQDTIISVNNIRQSRLIQVGQYLKIPSMPGILYTVKQDGETPASIAQKYEIDAQKCASVNSIKTDTELLAGVSVFVPDAELDWVTRQEINGDLFHKPLRARYWLSSPYGWRSSPFTGKRSFHSGMDMACGSGTPIYAALDGKVTATGYNDTYGNYVIISHHSGYRTLYAHMSSISCKKGNFVYTNTVIGKVGSTGMSTGPHLHFMVYKNGKTVNPASLIN